MNSEYFVAICNHLTENPEAMQLELASDSKLSLGLVNTVLQESLSSGYLRQETDKRIILTSLGQDYLQGLKTRGSSSNNKATNEKILRTIAKVFNAPDEKIRNIRPIKVGMTNCSFSFIYDANKYILRIPGEGTDKLIDRKKEYTVYQVIAPLKICDDLVYIDPETGYKISKFIENARPCDPLRLQDVRLCMKKLREFHELNLHVEHSFNIFERIEYYEGLRHKTASVFPDYAETKANVLRLKEYIDSADKKWTLSHIDAVPDNFIFIKTDAGEQIRIIDWEYAGMQDPHVDIAMFSIYSLYNKNQIDTLIDCYFYEGCPDDTRLKIYAYISVCGLLWSNWCEYKSLMGVEFDEYAQRQYRYAADFYRIFLEELW